jgi:hypothetical protein
VYGKVGDEPTFSFFSPCVHHSLHKSNLLKPLAANGSPGNSWFSKRNIRNPIFGVTTPDARR